MPTSESLTDFHHAYLRAYPAPGPQPFGVYPIDPATSQQQLPYNRRDFYQITLYTSGTTELRYAGESLLLDRPALMCYNPLAPYSCHAQTPLTGFFCLFTADFLRGPGYAAPLQESPLFQLGTTPAVVLTDAQCAFISQLFRQMLAEVNSTYRYKYDLLRTQVQLLLHEALRLRPELQQTVGVTAADRLAAQFVQVLERQFPVTSPIQPLELNTAEAFAAYLGVHANYLNRMLRQATGLTTSAHLARRIAQEAKALLSYTAWPIADISDSLRFTDPTYFAHFFRKHTGFSPTAFRQQVLGTGAGSEVRKV